MRNCKSLCKSVSRYSKREISSSKALERSFSKKLNACKSNFNRMGRLVESTSKDIREERLEMARLKEDEERRQEEERLREEQAKTEKEIMRKRM